MRPNGPKASPSLATPRLTRPSLRVPVSWSGWVARSWSSGDRREQLRTPSGTALSTKGAQEMPVAPVTTWGEALMTSGAAALAMFLGAVPRVLAFVLILLIGWLIASALAGVVAALLRAVKFNDLATRSGFAKFVHEMGVRTDASGVIATIAKWFV